MKTYRNLLAVFGIIGLSFCQLQAQTVHLTNVISVAFTIWVQGATNDNGTTATFAPPAVMKMRTQDLLSFLAKDEFAEGHYGSPSFPPGSMLVVNASNQHYQVVNGRFDLLVDVSDIMAGTNSGNTIGIGKFNDATSLGDPTVEAIGIHTTTFDDTGISGGANLQFYFQGLTTASATVISPKTGSGVSKIAGHGGIKNASGDGLYHGVPLAISGSLTSAGKGTITQ